MRPTPSHSLEHPRLVAYCRRCSTNDSRLRKNPPTAGQANSYTPKIPAKVPVADAPPMLYSTLMDVGEGAVLIGLFKMDAGKVPMSKKNYSAIFTQAERSETLIFLGFI